ncbi:Heterokaryon incompatibility protein 6, OR allele [Colletotrichum trifolii]|uniref:Heterokaryon incompatibility protein 6, OR allele n=1 Tax=Colletotrichum trifolii TaxID=5466 RepID=A0A4R8RHX6_COLTR|nr:Heterokaryon incompatibility protein 6, OR allele [Colletotrichum trifolii]
MNSWFVQKYEYAALRTRDSVRVVALESASQHEAKLRCSIIQYSRLEQSSLVDTERDYAAVSYARGTAEPSRMLMVDGTSCLQMTPTVDSILRHLRKPNKTRHLWIDAVCLDQSNADEKAEQIPQMGAIYKGAKKVHVWLGEADHSTAGLFSAARKLSSLPHSSYSRETRQRILEQTIGPNYFSRIQALLDREWFKRRWVIQEASLARHVKVHCGSYSHDLSSLIPLARLATEEQDDDVCHRLWFTQDLRWDPKPILELLWIFHDAECLDPMDRVAALLGLARESALLTLDYTAHWTTIYQNLAEAMFLQGGMSGRQLLLHLFEFGQLSDVHPSCPSWVPDWSKERNVDFPYYADQDADGFSHSEEPGYPEVAVFLPPSVADSSHLGLENGTTRWHSDRRQRDIPSWTQSRHVEMIFDKKLLYVRWHDSSGGPRGRTLATLLRMPSLPDVPFTTSVRRLLKTFFPEPEVSKTKLATMSMLFHETILMRNPSAPDHWSEAYIRFTIESLLEKRLPPLLNDQNTLVEEMYDILLGSSLFELVPLQDEVACGTRTSLSYVRGDFGIGPRRLEPSDVLIPAWRLGQDPRRREAILSGQRTERFTAAMMVVRLLPRDSFQVSQRWVRRASIIGPATCVLSDATQRYAEHDGQLASQMSHDLTTDQPCLLQLV